MIFPQNVSPRRAAEVLHRVFDGIPGGFAFRLWDGSVVNLGGGTPVCTAVVHQPQTFIRLIRDPTPLTFAELVDFGVTGAGVTGGTGGVHSGLGGAHGGGGGGLLPKSTPSAQRRNAYVSLCSRCGSLAMSRFEIASLPTI